MATRTRRSRRDPAVPAVPEEALPGPVPESLRREFEELGLSPYEARVILALLRLGSANTIQIARVSEVPRTSTYQVLEALHARRLAEPLPTEGPAVWAAPARDQIFERLEAAEEERLRDYRSRTSKVRELLDETFPDTPSVALPYVHLLKGPAQVKRSYEQLLGDAKTELVMFTRPPYTWALGRPNPAVLDMLDRGVKTRVLYQTKEWEDPNAEAFRQEVYAYHRAGVQARLSASLPIKLVVVDRKSTLVGMNDPVPEGAGYPITLFIEHPGYAEIQAQAFERMWEFAVPLTRPEYPPTEAAAGDGGEPGGRLAAVQL